MPSGSQKTPENQKRPWWLRLPFTTVLCVAATVCHHYGIDGLAVIFALPAIILIHWSWFLDRQDYSKSDDPKTPTADR
jgi:hypothetical protein